MIMPWHGHVHAQARYTHAHAHQVGYMQLGRYMVVCVLLRAWDCYCCSGISKSFYIASSQDFNSCVFPKQCFILELWLLGMPLQPF